MSQYLLAVSDGEKSAQDKQPASVGIVVVLSIVSGCLRTHGGVKFVIDGDDDR